ncbi:MAG: hypothetical protein IID59_00425 [Proteobacteria bacterium]|nr:hypothetical protein [Pseudomonadota bacterium]MCH8137157.1 hypothetical protein [Pseudomonadota bacterium]
MNDELNGGTPMTHWLVAGAALIWNLFGFMVYLMTVRATPEQLAQQYSAAEIAFMDAVPVWATSANAIAVTAGVIACVLLLLRKSLALPLFVASLAALLVQDLYSFVLEDVVGVFGMVPAYIQGTVLVIAIALIFYTLGVKSRGLLN